MASHVESQMRRAERLINAGRKKEALELLRPLTESNPDQARLWWLVACSAAKPETQRKALEKALRLQPHFPEAQRMLDVVNLLPAGANTAALQTMELLRAETSQDRPSTSAIPLLLVVFILVLVVGATGVFVLQQMNAAPATATALSTAVVAAMPSLTPEMTAEVAIRSAEPARITLNADTPFSFELPEGDCWQFNETMAGGLILCVVEDEVLFSVSLNTPYVLEAMNAPEQSEIMMNDHLITLFEGNPVVGIASGDALWLVTDKDGKLATLLAVTSAVASSDTLDPYKDALVALLLSIAWE